MEFLREMFLFLKTRKKYWLLPMMVMLLIFGAIVFLAGGTAAAPQAKTVRSCWTGRRAIPCSCRDGFSAWSFPWPRLGTRMERSCWPTGPA